MKEDTHFFKTYGTTVLLGGVVVAVAATKGVCSAASAMGRTTRQVVRFLQKEEHIAADHLIQGGVNSFKMKPLEGLDGCAGKK